VVVGRLARNAALWSLPAPKPKGQPGPRATYGKERISLGTWYEKSIPNYEA
jgi:hypothetical protein